MEGGREKGRKRKRKGGVEGGREGRKGVPRSKGAIIGRPTVIPEPC